MAMLRGGPLRHSPSTRAGAPRSVALARPLAPSRRRAPVTSASSANAVTITKLSTGAWVVAPRSRARGVVHFLGGAFAGAAPQVLYGLLLESLAAAGYTAIATPYPVTFRHDDCAREVRRQFVAALEELRAGVADPASQQPEGQQGQGPPPAGGAVLPAGLGPDAAPLDVPVVGMGHSNGALLHLLIPCYCPDAALDSNVIISYNNKQVSDAIPIPGLLEGFPAAMRAARAAADALPFPLSPPFPFPLPPGVTLPGSPSEALAAAAALLPPALRAGVDGAGQLSSAGMLLDQIPAVFGEVNDGATDFYPPPAASRALIAASYRVAPTLLVRFSDDSIDESDTMGRLLAPALGRGVTLLTLPGSHITPCGGDVPLPSPAEGAGPGPDALAAAAALRGAAQADLRRLAGQVVGWMDSLPRSA